MEAWCKAEGETIEVDGKPVPITPKIFEKAMHEVYRGRYGPGGSTHSVRPSQRGAFRDAARQLAPMRLVIFHLPVALTRSFETVLDANGWTKSRTVSAVVCHFLKSDRSERTRMMTRLDRFLARESSSQGCVQMANLWPNLAAPPPREPRPVQG